MMGPNRRVEVNQNVGNWLQGVCSCLASRVSKGGAQGNEKGEGRWDYSI